MTQFAPYECQFDDAERKQLIAEALINLRTANGYTQKQVAEWLGVHPATYNGYEKAKNEPSAERIVRLSFLYKVPTDMILQKGRISMDASDDLQKQLDAYSKEIDGFKEVSMIQRDTAIMQMIDKVSEFIDVMRDMSKQQREKNTNE